MFVSKKGHLGIISANTRTANEVLYQMIIPLEVSNALPGSNIRLGANDNDKAFLLGF